jgi:hypothetical protein
VSRCCVRRSLDQELSQDLHTSTASGPRLLVHQPQLPDGSEFTQEGMIQSAFRARVAGARQVQKCAAHRGHRHARYVDDVGKKVMIDVVDHNGPAASSFPSDRRYLNGTSVITIEAPHEGRRAVGRGGALARPQACGH